MLRREFIKATGTVIAASALPGTTVFAAEKGTQTRTILPINRKWRYHPAKVEGAHLPAFNDAAFESVVIPHTNISLPWHNFDDKDYEFISTYRRRFRYSRRGTGQARLRRLRRRHDRLHRLDQRHPLGEYKGGFTPFSFELTDHLHPDGENVLVVQVDSTERADIPPFGYEIDYMTFGGIYREVSLRIVSPTYIDNIFARPKDVLTANPGLDVDVFLAGKPADGLALEVELRDGDRVVARGHSPAALTASADPQACTGSRNSAPVYASTETTQDPSKHTVTLANLEGIKLWELEHPNLYTVHVRLLKRGQAHR